MSRCPHSPHGLTESSQGLSHWFSPERPEATRRTVAAGSRRSMRRRWRGGARTLGKAGRMTRGHHRDTAAHDAHEQTMQRPRIPARSTDSSSTATQSSKSDGKQLVPCSHAGHYRFGGTDLSSEEPSGLLRTPARHEGGYLALRQRPTGDTGGAHRSTGGGRGRTSRGQISHRCHRRHDARTHGRRPQMKNRPRLAVDTSVAIPLLVASHQAHEAVHAWAKGRRLSLSGHALAETYAVLTRLPGDARVSPADAVRLIDDWFLETLTLPTASIVDVHRRLARLGISGGAVYDGIVALAALENGAILATRDARARATYEAVGTSVEILHSADSAEE